MTTPAQRKGDNFERLVRDYMRSAGLPVERPRPGMPRDRGDLCGIEDWTLELKCYTDLHRAVRDGLADLEHEQAAADTPYGAVIVKRRGTTDPGSQLVVMELWQLVALIVQGRKQRSAT